MSAHGTKPTSGNVDSPAANGTLGTGDDALEAVGGVLQHRQQRCRFARHLHFPNDLASVIHNADDRVLDRNVQSSKILHAALLLLMLEARSHGDLVSPSA